MPDFNQLNSLLMGQLNNNTAFQAGAQGINDLTQRNIQGILSRLATSGLGRSGIGGSLINKAYGKSANSLTKLAATESDRRTQIINQLLGLYTTQEKFDRSKLGIGDVFGSILGLVGGSALGPVGAALGGKLGDLLTGGGGNGGNLFMPGGSNGGSFVPPDTTLKLSQGK